MDTEIKKDDPKEEDRNGKDQYPCPQELEL